MKPSAPIRVTAAAAVGIGLAARGLLWRSRVRRSASAPTWVPPPRGAEPSPDVAVVVPVLAEQPRLDRLVEHMRDLRAAGEPVALVLASTTREPAVPGLPGTPELCDRWAARYPWICHHQVDDPAGMMASQLNGVLDVCSRVRESRYVAIYNADSLPAAGTLSTAAQIMDRHPRPVVVQQHGLYLRNWHDLGTAPPFSRAVLRAAAAWQCRWSLGFERVHALRSARARVAPAARRLPAPFAYVIGHGLQMRLADLVAAGRFTERFPNEDAHLSVALAARGVAVVPNPHWELADSPDSLRGLLVQKRVWFHGPAGALRYRRDLRDSGVAADRDLRLPAYRLLHHAICWAGGPLLAAGALLAAGPATFAGVLAGLVVYLVPANDLALRRAAELSGLRVRPAERLEAALGAPVAYALHGASAYWAVALSLRHALLGTAPGKPRTPMRWTADSNPLEEAL
ncbi:glycosyltransferase [Umezawaea sp.]|uniref:glycosyltransferase n=1 Tax=Umezawaea sp. TaxID=1955258 RepID=UPI002ED2A2E8